MTTEAAAMLYESQHPITDTGKQNAIFNPLERPVEALPIIYGFNNGGSDSCYSAVLIAENGTYLGCHTCSSEAYMPADLGILEGTRPDRHEQDFQPYYPEGYRMAFVSQDEFEACEGLVKAVEIANALVLMTL